jgi:class 3 adenylate cyclase
MDKDRIQELLEARAHAELELERLRSPVTILFSDIKGSTAYFEKKGDLDGLAMVQRHNALLSPVIEECGGRVVKTIGDSIMAAFIDPVGAVKAAVGMQRTLESDRAGRSDLEQIHIRIGLHTGLGIVKDNDVFGDVVNAAARVQRQAQPDQILITDVLIEAADTAGCQCIRLGKADLRGKDEPIDLYAVAWSESANDQLMEELHSQFEQKMKDMKRMQEQIENDFETTRDKWRHERRRLTGEIERLEEALENAKETTRRQFSDDLQSEIRFQLEETVRSRQQTEHEFASASAKWEAERKNLRAQLDAMQRSVVEGIERSNNPARMALAVREQVDARVKKEKSDWQLQWEGERKRLTAEIDRLRKARTAKDEKKDAAKNALLQKLGKLPPGSGPVLRTADEWETEFNQARVLWENERDQLTLEIHKLQNELRRNADTMRSELFHEMRTAYEPRLAEEARERKRLEKELEAVNLELAAERQRLTARVEQIEQSIPEAQAAARKQVAAELTAEFEAKLEEANRVKARLERRFQDVTEELEAERRRDRKLITQLEEQLKEARETAFKVQRSKMS